MKPIDIDKTLTWMALSGQIQHFKSELPTRFVWAFAGWIIGIVTVTCLVR